MSDLRGYHLGADDGVATWFLDTLMTLKAGADDTRGAFTLIDCLAPAGFGPPLHVHHREDEGFYVLEGALSILCGQDRWTATPGSFVLLPRDVPHAFTVSEEGPCRLLQITAPAQFEQFVVDAGRPAERRTLPEPSAPDVGALAQAAARYGNEIVGPPLALQP